MKAFLLSALFVSASVVANAAVLDTHYDGQILSASKKISVRFEDGRIETFDVSKVIKGSISNESYSKGATLKLPRKSPQSSGTCGSLIGELASDYSFKIKTDENEIATITFKASTAELPIRVAGDCDNKISEDFTLFAPNDLPLNLTAVMSQQPAGAPAPEARYYGKVLKLTPKVSVRQKDGTIRVLDATGLKVGGLYNDMQSVSLSENGMTSRCADSLGMLASDFAVTVQTAKGMIRTATVHAPAAGASDDNQVHVFGECHGDGLSQLQLDSNSAALFEIH